MNNRIPLRQGSGRFIKYFIFVLVIFVIAIAVKALSASSAPSSTSSKVQLKEAVATKPVSKDINIIIADEDGEELDPVTMRIDNVELREEIIVQGQKATSVEGRGFLVVNLKLVNPLESGVEINTKDYLRLGENDSNEWLAPDIHNDPVVIQAISTKPTRVAFPVNIETRRFSLQVGEIAGEKEIIEIDFNK